MIRLHNHKVIRTSSPTSLSLSLSPRFQQKVVELFGPCPAPDDLDHGLNLPAAAALGVVFALHHLHLGEVRGGGDCGKANVSDSYSKVNSNSNSKGRVATTAVTMIVLHLLQ